MWTAHSGPSLFDHLKSVFFQFNNVNIFKILLDGIFYTHNIDASNYCLHIFLSSFFSSSRLSPTATARFRNKWWVDFSFSSALITAKRFLLSFSSALTFLRNFRRTSREERLARKDTWRLKFEAARFEPSILITFYLWKFFAGTGDWTQFCTPNHVFDAFTAKQHWCRHEN